MRVAWRLCRSAWRRRSGLMLAFAASGNASGCASIALPQKERFKCLRWHPSSGAPALALTHRGAIRQRVCSHAPHAPHSLTRRAASRSLAELAARSSRSSSKRTRTRSSKRSRSRSRSRARGGAASGSQDTRSVSASCRPLDLTLDLTLALTLALALAGIRAGCRTVDVYM